MRVIQYFLLKRRNHVKAIQYFLSSTLSTLNSFSNLEKTLLMISFIILTFQRNHMKSIIFLTYFSISLLSQNNQHTRCLKNIFQQSRFFQKSTFFSIFAYSTERFVVDMNLISKFLLILSSSQEIFLEQSKEEEEKSQSLLIFTSQRKCESCESYESRLENTECWRNKSKWECQNSNFEINLIFESRDLVKSWRSSCI